MISPDQYGGHGAEPNEAVDRNARRLTATDGRDEIEGASSTVLDPLTVVGRRKGLVVFGLLLSFMLSWLYYFHATPIYEASVQVLVIPRNTTLPTQSAETKESVSSYSADASLLSTHVQLFQSRRIIKQAIEKRRLDRLASLAKSIEEGRDPVDSIMSRLDVSKGGKGASRDACVLRASFQDPVKEDAFTILNALVESYQDFLARTFKDASAEAVQLITQAKNDLEAEIRKQETEYREFCEQSPLIWKGKESQNIHQQRVAELEKQLSETRAEYTQTKARLDVISEAMKRGTSASEADMEKLALLSVKDIARITQLLTTTRGKMADEKMMIESANRSESTRTEYQTLLALQLEMQQLLQEYGPDHPRVKAAQDKIKLLKDFLRDKTNTGTSALGSSLITPNDLLKLHYGLLQHDLNEMSQRQKDLEKLAREEEAAAKRLATYEIQGEMMRSALTRKSDLFEVVVQRLRDISLLKDYGGGYLTEIISPVEVPQRPVSPRLLITLAVGLVLGAFAGCAMAYMAELSDRTFRDPEEICRMMRAPIMAHMPTFSARARAAALANGKDLKGKDPLLVSYHRPTSREAEIFRSVRTALYFSSLAKQHRVIQITSPHPGDGKTTLSTNLAVSMAQVGRRVLLVDCDFRRPQVHKVFNISGKVGLANVLTGEAQLADVIQAIDVNNLWILPAGTHPGNPSELLTLPVFEQFVRQIRDQYDFVIIDTPPLLAVSDPAVVAPRVDGVLMTLRVEKNGRPPVVQAREILTRLGVDVLGLVVNGLAQDRRYGYGYYGRYYDKFAENYIPSYYGNRGGSPSEKTSVS